MSTMTTRVTANGGWVKAGSLASPRHLSADPDTLRAEAEEILLMAAYIEEAAAGEHDSGVARFTSI